MSTCSAQAARIRSCQLMASAMRALPKLLHSCTLSPESTFVANGIDWASAVASTARASSTQPS